MNECSWRNLALASLCWPVLALAQTPEDKAPQDIPATTVAAPAAASVAAPIDRFEIKDFAIEGNTLLPPGQASVLLAPFIGPDKDYGDVQQALEALENAYRSLGYSTVIVHVPEQELTQGHVRLQVRENRLGKVAVTGNAHFATDGVRASLPALQEGTVPNARRLSENIQLANENPARQVNVTLAMGEADGTVDAKVAVTEDDPQKFIVSLNNTGTSSTGRSRLSVAYQHADVLKSDHTLTLAYTGSLDAPGDVKVDIYSLAYRLPLYTLGDSIELMYGNSSVNTPSVQATGFGLAGKGEVASLRYNHYFPRSGAFSSKISASLEYKYFNTRCSVGGVPVPFDPPLPPLASCVPYTTRPLSLTYSGGWQGLDLVADYNIGLSYNLPLGTRYLYPASGQTDYYSTIAGRPVSDHFSILRFGGSLTKALPADWQGRLAFSGQYSHRGLVSGEQFGLAGSTAVRGFGERAVATDTGYLLNLEIYTPELAKYLGIPGSLRSLGFLDLASGRNLGVLQPTEGTAGTMSVASTGLGVRYNFLKSYSLRADMANVLKAGPTGTEDRGDWYTHFSLMASF
ncbi:MAG: ShlB/FhaC/HecB family hemolysin secretion/activation protein [Sterolibacterium sp.]|nr:ShlB/FhaC/HecB family hemolysin secretion/activation protein [Sterolibacterium sp.]MBP9799959.1 ShlB/FhaC/HecB family hemolysin secretion/activation protein [Sterolibacterium sp.]